MVHGGCVSHSAPHENCFVDIVGRARSLVDQCHVCKDFTDEKWTECCMCLMWCHMKCGNLYRIKQNDIPKINMGIHPMPL